MSLTTVTVTGKWRLPDATIPTGTVRFEPSAAFQNTTDDTFVVNSVEATLDASGAISVDLYATDDADTTPDGAQYVVTERIAGATRIYNVEIPSANPSVDLADLVPTTTPSAVTYLTPSSHDARDHSAALSAASVRDLADGADVPVDDGTLAVGDLVTVKSLSPLVVEGTASGTYATADAVAARVYRGTSAQSIPNTSLTAIQFNAEAFDTDLIHDNSTNPNRLTVPSGKGGLWHVAATVQYAASTGGALRAAIIRVNGTTVVADNNPGATAYHTSRHVSVSAAVDLDLDDGDYVEVMAYQDSGGALDVNFGEQKTHASFHRLGASPLA